MSLADITWSYTTMKASMTIYCDTCGGVQIPGRDLPSEHTMCTCTGGAPIIGKGRFLFKG